MAENDQDGEERSGNGAVWGVLFVVALTLGAIFLIQQMRNSASLLECAFTHAPKCRALVDDK